MARDVGTGHQLRERWSELVISIMAFSPRHDDRIDVRHPTLLNTNSIADQTIVVLVASMN